MQTCNLFRAAAANLARSRRNALALTAHEFIVYEIVFACARLKRFHASLCPHTRIASKSSEHQIYPTDKYIMKAVINYLKMIFY